MAEVRYAELIQRTRHRWGNNLSPSRRDELLELPFVSRVVGYRIYFAQGYEEGDVKRTLERALIRLVQYAEVKYFYVKEPPSVRLEEKLAKPEAFRSLAFGSDVAEQERDQLSHYFVSTPAFQNARDGLKSVIIGPKGSGKTAILQSLTATAGSGYSIVITPEVFATSMLRQFVEDSKGTWDEDQAFVSTWVFTILVEVFKRVCDKGRGIPEKALKTIRVFLRDNANYHDMDLFTRFIGYLKRIQGIKVGTYELTVKTKLLQELYALEKVYELIPPLRSGLKEDILILIDELDQGWDNSPHSNRFVSSLVQAAIRIQRLGLRVRVVVFIRSEIFDLVEPQLDQLDKLRSSIEIIRWTRNELAGLLLKRIDYSLGTSVERVEHEFGLLGHIFRESCHGVFGFDYVVSRTTRRPREVLQFVRLAHELAVAAKRTSITEDSILQAEEGFSGWKIKHLCSEYRFIFPGLNDLLWSFRGSSAVLNQHDIEERIGGYRRLQGERLPGWAHISNMDVAQHLYSVEFLGVDRRLATRATSGILAEYEFAYDRPAANVKAAQSFLVHPAFWNALEITPV